MKSKILKITGFILLIITALIWATPFLFKGSIDRLVKSQFNKNFRAHVSFSGASISLFRHFPDISIGLDHLMVTCVGEFQDDTLIIAQRLDINCDMKSILSGDSIRIHSVILDGPQFHLAINKEGHVNWNIIRSVT